MHYPLSPSWYWEWVLLEYARWKWITYRFCGRVIRIRSHSRRGEVSKFFFFFWYCSFLFWYCYATEVMVESAIWIYGYIDLAITVFIPRLFCDWNTVADLTGLATDGLDQEIAPIMGPGYWWIVHPFPIDRAIHETVTFRDWPGTYISAREIYHIVSRHIGRYVVNQTGPDIQTYRSTHSHVPTHI